ncbi:MAG: AI-2E family transporter [Acidimicrobiales bacterium]|nr:AI-2E family transporter [Acidimicrobiales bacterium]
MTADRYPALAAGLAARRASWQSSAGLGGTDRPLLHRLGLASWSLIGVIALATVVVLALAAISSVLLPLLFAAVLAVLFRPLAGRMERRGIPAAAAAGIVVAGLVLTCAGVIGLIVTGVIDQSDRLADEIESALVEMDVSEQDIAELRQKVEDLDPSVRAGLAKVATTGARAVAGFAVGVLLGVLIMYYLIKDGPELRQALVRRVPGAQARDLDKFLSDITYVLRRYWLGRSIVSAIVASVVGAAALLLGLPLVPTLVVVTFLGGFIPYVGAVLGGALAVVVGLASGGVVPAVTMLVVALAANLVIENLVEPMVTGRTLQIHPLAVLVVTTLGGIIGGVVGLIMAVPIAVISVRALPALRRALDEPVPVPVEERPGSAAQG